MTTRSPLLLLGSILLACGCSSNPGANDGGSGGPDGGFDGDPPDVGQPQCDAAACSSGACAPDGGCAAGCKGNSDCASGETCCNTAYCSDLAKDPKNCGACGNVCGGTQFCSGAACVDALVKNVCQNAAGTVVLDNLDVDDTAGSAVGSAITGACSSVALTSVTQGAAGTMDATSGRPTTGPGNTYVAAGGGFGQKAIAYMNNARNAPVVTTDDSQNVSFVRAADGTTIIKAPISSLTAHHDYFLVYAAAEPVSGTLVFAVYGLYPAGTAAGAYWLKSQSGGVATMDKQYYVYEWTDGTNNDGIANAGDTFKLLESK